MQSLQEERLGEGQAERADEAKGSTQRLNSKEGVAAEVGESDEKERRTDEREQEMETLNE